MFENNIELLIRHIRAATEIGEMERRQAFIEPTGEVRMAKLFGGIEAGGTKFVCLVGSGPEQVVNETRFATASPEDTLRRVAAFFDPYLRQGELAAVGIGCFGPLDLDPLSPTCGWITTTAKPGWAQLDLQARLTRQLGVPVAMDTDVNAAAFGEYYWPKANQGLDPLVYVTAGTGIGMGAVVSGKPLHGMIHPEAGHMWVPHNLEKDPFRGNCSYHGDCLEGLAAGPAMAERWGMPGEVLPDSHPGWDLEADYLALAVCNLIYALSPQRIVLGGGVCQHAGLLPRVRQKVARQINGYLYSPRLQGGIDAYITLPALGNRSGVLGAMALAITALDSPA
jgi:fructokinase